MNAKHPPLELGERFVGNVQDGQPLGMSFIGLDVALRKPAYDVSGNPLPGFSAIVLTAAGCAEYNRRQERRLELIRAGGSQ